MDVRGVVQVRVQAAAAVAVVPNVTLFANQMEVAKSTQDGRKEAEPNGLKDLVSLLTLVANVPDFRILADLAFKIAKEEKERVSPLMDCFRNEIDTKG